MAIHTRVTSKRSDFVIQCYQDGKFIVAHRRATQCMLTLPFPDRRSQLTKLLAIVHVLNSDKMRVSVDSRSTHRCYTTDFEQINNITTYRDTKRDYQNYYTNYYTKSGTSAILARQLKRFRGSYFPLTSAVPKGLLRNPERERKCGEIKCAVGANVLNFFLLEIILPLNILMQNSNRTFCNLRSSTVCI